MLKMMLNTITNLSCSGCIIGSANWIWEIPNFLLEDYDAVLKFMNAEIKKKAKTYQNWLVI